ncbi:HNH endonuclease signature motif containing protein [Megamonas funiformis]|uniref:HNH endonuclease signature motif containing protein n=1 Tax=Megamonas funiformis TaxID=437897 RepID=UPI003FEFABD7
MNIDNKLIVDKNFGKFSFNTDWETIEISGITITPLDKNFSIKNNELFYKNTKVLLYIRDQAMYGQPEDALKNYKSAYKFHLSWCQTLQTMFNSGKYEKYVVSTRQDDVLLVRAIGSNNKVYESEQKLHVCRYCLSTLNYKGYRYATKAQKDKIYNEFSLKEFFNVQNSDYSFHDMPKHDEYSAKTNIYPDNWEHVSELHRKLCHYQCERCGKDCSHDHSLLHVHHKNGNKQDIRQSNLIALCLECHISEHPHMKNLY